jgi:hypothetical protein
MCAVAAQVEMFRRSWHAHRGNHREQPQATGQSIDATGCSIWYINDAMVPTLHKERRYSTSKPTSEPALRAAQQRSTPYAGTHDAEVITCTSAACAANIIQLHVSAKVRT